MKKLGKVNDLFYNLFLNKKSSQILSLFSANLLGIPIGMITSIFLTRFLGPKIYGDYMFLMTLINLIVLLCGFGFFHAGNRAIVLTKFEKKIKELYGAELFYLIISGLAVILVLSIMIIYDSNLELKGLKSITIFLLPFSWVFILIKFYESLLQADNRIKLLSSTRLFPKIVFLLFIAILTISAANSNLTKLQYVFSAFIISQLIVFVYVFHKIKISFKNTKHRMLQIWKLNKEFGIHIYVGSVFAVGFAHLSGVLIGYFGADNSGVGFYSLALTMAMPLSFIPNTIATSYYKEFSIINKVPVRLIALTSVISIIVLLFSWIVIDPFITFFYGDKFSSVINLFYYVSFGMLIHGMADFFNRYLGAQGQGKILRNSSFFVGGILLILNVVLIPNYGELGASITKCLTAFFYLIIILYYYNSYIKKSSK